LLEVKVFFASALGFKKYIDPNFKREISWGNLKLDQFDHQFLNGEVILPADKALDAPALDDALDLFKPDMLVLHGYFQKFQRRAYRWGTKKKVKMAYVSDSEQRQKRGGVKEWIKSMYVKKYFSGIDLFLTVGDANEEYYRQHHVPAGKMVRMHFSIDRALYRKAHKEKKELADRVRAQYDIPPGDIVISVVGKLVEWKNQGDIIAAIKALERQGVFFHLLIIGSGETMETLKNQASGLGGAKIYFPGFVNPEDLPGYYAASDIYIHPASVEPHSLAISEAIYMGCPAIISDRCGSYGPSDDVQEGKNGYVYRCGDIPDLAAKISSLCKNVDRMMQFGEYSHKLGVEFQERSHGGFVRDMIEKAGL